MKGMEEMRNKGRLLLKNERGKLSLLARWAEKIPRPKAQGCGKELVHRCGCYTYICVLCFNTVNKVLSRQKNLNRNKQQNLNGANTT